MVARMLLASLVIASSRHVAPGCEQHLPVPFHDLERWDILRLVYPRADTSGHLGVVDAGGRALAGALCEPTLWDGEDEVMLAVLVETWTPDHRGLPPVADDARYGVDLALVALREGVPVLVACLRDASEHGIRGGAGLDLTGGASIGIRVSDAREDRDALRIFRRAGRSFHLVFAAEARPPGAARAEAPEVGPTAPRSAP